MCVCGVCGGGGVTKFELLDTLARMFPKKLNLEDIYRAYDRKLLKIFVGKFRSNGSHAYKRLYKEGLPTSSTWIPKLGCFQ